MPLQSWSKKVRQHDFTLPWAIQIGKDAASGENGQITLTVNNVAIGTFTVSASTEDTAELWPSLPDSEMGPGQIIRGIYKFNTPISSDDNSFKQGFSITNSGTNNLTIINIFRSFLKMYPGEHLDSSSTTDTDLSPQDKLDYGSFYESITSEGSLSQIVYQRVTENLTHLPASANLTAAFNSLSSSSTQSDIDEILNSEDFRSYYGEQLPVSNLPIQLSEILNSEKTARVDLPIVLSPGETIRVVLTKELTEYFTNPFKVSI